MYQQQATVLRTVTQSPLKNMPIAERWENYGK
jgi:hypothetical protein